MIPPACVKQIFGESFAMRPTTFTMPWGTVYVCIEMVLMYSETSYRLANSRKIIAIEETYDQAYLKACDIIRAQIDG